MKTPNNRTELPQFLNENGLTGSMVEIGVAFGGFAKEVLSTWKGRAYFMVDPWENQPKEVYKERTEGIPYNAWFAQCEEMARNDKRIQIIRDYSVNAAKQFPDSYFDCVYIDGNHCYEAVVSDLEAWWPKVKSGGLFSGHDCYNVTTDGHYCEVLRAIEGRSGVYNHSFTITPCTSWWTIKP